MTLRLVLVSLVAALGLTIPGTSMIESWVASTQNWMHARFADWDTRNPPPADYVIVSDYYDPALLSRPTTDVPATPSDPDVSATKPILPVARTVMSATGKGPNLPTAGDGGHVVPVAFASRTMAFTPLETGHQRPEDIAYELNRRSEGIRVTLSQTTYRQAIRTRWQPLAIPGEPAATLADALNAVSQGNEIMPTKPACRAVEKPAPEPIEVPEILQVGIAYELNRRAEGIGITPPPVLKASKPLSEVVVVATAPVRREFAAMEDDANLYFAGSLLPTFSQGAATSSPSEKSSRASATPIIVRAATSRMSSIRTDDLEDLCLDVAGELVSSGDGFGIWTRPSAPTAKASIANTRRPFESLSVEDQPRLSVVDEMNRINDGLSIPKASPTRPAETPRNTRSLFQAVRLTRDAVYAWVNVLAGPAIVTASNSK